MDEIMRIIDQYEDRQKSYRYCDSGFGSVET